MFKRNKQKEELRQQRQPTISYQRQTAYHYSAKRSGADRVLNRNSEIDRTDSKTQSKWRLRSLPLVVGIIIFGSAFLYLLSLSTSAQITINGKQDLLRDKKLYQNRADQILKTSFTNRFKLTFNEDKLKQDMQVSFPEIATVSVSSPLFAHNPHVDIALAEPAVLLSSSNSIYLLDERGKVLFDTKKNKPNFDTTTLPLVQDQSSINIEQNKPALTSSQVAFIHEVRKQSDAKNLVIESMVMVNGGGEIDLRYSDVDYFIKLNMFEDARKSIGTYFAIREKITTDKLKVSEYIDVRIPERAYIK
jgi:hypothetical protein